ncbi:MAG: IS4 family transposase [Succinivibrio sp.]
MSKLSIFPASLSTARSFTNILSKENLKQYARDCGALKRERKFSIPDYILSALTQMCKSTEKSEFTLCSVHDAYLRGCRKLRKALLTHKCIHKQLQSGNTLKVIKTMLSELMTASFGKSFLKKVKKLISGDLKTLLEKLRVDDIILVDGTEIDLSYSCADNFDCKSRGRPHADGSAPRPGLKLHIAFSVLRQSFIYVEITEAVGSERDSVITDRFHNCLIICDRGYVDDELEQRITDSGNLYLIRGKLSTAASIDRAIGDDGKSIPEFKGKTVNKLPSKSCADLDVTFASGHKNRVIVRYNPNCTDDDKRSILRTNIPRDRLGAKQIYLLYRLRWAIELFNKANKRSNCLKSINSANENIILSFILLSLAVSIIKTFTGLKCSINKSFEWISMLKLHKQNDCFERLFKALLFRKSSTVYQIFKELLDDIALSCQRTKPSNRDISKLKDLPTLVWQIVNQPNPSAKIA